MFTKARIRLTAWYLLIITCISLSFSAVIYVVQTHELDRFVQAQRYRIERRLLERDSLSSGLHSPVGSSRIIITDPELIEETKQRLLLILIGANGGILIISGCLGYLLAGRTLQPIKEMVDEQNRFVTDASHEFRTPLTSLKIAMEVALRDKKFSLQDAKALIADNLKEVDRFQMFSDELIQLAQYQKPLSHHTFSVLSLHELLNNAIHKISPMAKQKHIMIENTTEDVSFMGNTHSLTDLFLILLDNAVKYSPRGQTIEVTSRLTDNAIHISVTDHGFGMEKKDTIRIFDRFYRADTARSQAGASGYGLGLSIAKKIVELHNGTIAVSSTRNAGSTFTVQLPILKGKA